MSEFPHKVHIFPHGVQIFFGLRSFKREDNVFVIRVLLRCFGGE